ncbi:MAG: FAD-dependent thymidylate synthase [Myxococcota bacterium]|jgi:thymidylate synthase (FAD)|nr:FAD-dependent thymidylate synthase [Myxococcota bacterium]
MSAPRQGDDLVFEPVVTLLARPQFLGVPPELGFPRSGQDTGTDAERLIEAAGRVCYDSYGKGRGSADYHRHLQEVGHGSVTEHALWSFLLAGVSRGLTHELVRHRVGVAYAQRSTRYVDEQESPWIVPPLFREQASDPPEVAALRRQACAELARVRQEACTGYARLLGLGQELLAQTHPGLEPAERRKLLRGAARSVLGQGLATSIVFSANLRALIHICQMRGVRHAEAEIRIVAAQLAAIMRAEVPAYFADLELTDAPDGLGPEVHGLPRLQPY